MTGRLNTRCRLDDPGVAGRPYEPNHWMFEKERLSPVRVRLAYTVGNCPFYRFAKCDLLDGQPVTP